MILGKCPENLTLRDWFAGQALSGLASDRNYNVEHTVKLAYRMADVMLDAREQVRANERRRQDRQRALIEEDT